MLTYAKQKFLAFKLGAWAAHLVIREQPPALWSKIDCVFIQVKPSAKAMKRNMFPSRWRALQSLALHQLPTKLCLNV